MKKISVQSLLQKLQMVVARFPFTLFFIVALSIEFMLKINNKDLVIPDHNWAFFSLGIPFTVALTLFFEEFKILILNLVINLLAIVLLLVYCFSLPDKFSTADISQLGVLGIVFILSAFVVSFLRRNSDVSFWEFSKTFIIQLIISFIFSQVLMMGLSLAILSLKELFKVDIDPKVYGNLAVVCYGLFAPVYFLANVPAGAEKHKQEFTFDKFLKILGLYILLPILAVYTLILYVYLIQIVVKWELPEGWVSWLVSILALGGFLCMLILYPLRSNVENKIVAAFSKFFPIVLLPLLVLMTIGIFRRFDDYGFTINRAYVFLLNFWLYGISIYLFVTKSAHLKWIVISFVTIAFISSVGPWSVYEVTRRNMLNEIGQLLNESHLLKNGKVIDNSGYKIKINDTLGTRLATKVEYVCMTFGSGAMQRFYKEPIGNKSAWDVEKTLGINEMIPKSKNGNNVNYFNANVRNENHVVQIDSYKTFIRINKASDVEEIYKTKELSVLYKNNTIMVKSLDGKAKTLSIPLAEKLNFIIRAQNKENSFTVDELTQENENYKLIINHIVGFQKPGTAGITVTDLQVELFIK
ncbi:MAG: DUF4153 domain-containing protein [Paludibacter sp.]